jgi:dihydroneopterin aldolase
MKTIIRLENMRFYAYHGVLAQEQIVGNQFSVSVSFEIDGIEAAETDELENTISYADVSDIVSQQMMIPSKLLEHVSGRIYRSLRAAFPQILRLEVSVYKYNPPGCGETERAGVTLSDW